MLYGTCYCFVILSSAADTSENRTNVIFIRDAILHPVCKYI